MLDRHANRRDDYDADEDGVIAGEGVIARIADHAFDNPAMTGGLVVMAMTAAAIVSNALFLQNGRHPDPLFMTRPAATAPAPAKPTPVPTPRARASQPAIKPPPLPREAPAPAATAAPVSDAALVTELQRGLADLGLYEGAVDGIAGSHTRAAISAYQKEHGLTVTGEASAALLERVKRSAMPSAMVATPAPAPAPPAPIAAAPNPAERAQARVEAVQAALNRIGYGPLTANGTISTSTEDAIRRFQLDNGLPINGKVDEKLVDRLVTIGAMQPL